MQDVGDVWLLSDHSTGTSDGHVLVANVSNVAVNSAVNVSKTVDASQGSGGHCLSFYFVFTEVSKETGIFYINTQNWL